MASKRKRVSKVASSQGASEAEVVRDPIGEEVERDRSMATYIAMVIRNAMEDFHVDNLSDKQMSELNPIIRNAVYTALHAVRHAPALAGPAAFIRFQLGVIPSYWEEPVLLEEYKETCRMDPKLFGGLDTIFGAAPKEDP